MTERILITGAGGQLGKALTERYTQAAALTRADLDITDPTQLDDIDWSQYDTIINAAAYVNADHSETPEGEELTWKANLEGPRNLARIAIKNNLHLIHFSSEYVFNGEISNHSEDEPFSPLSVYGKTKAAADEVVGEVPNHHIFRTTWVVGDGHNFVKTMARLAEMRIDPKVVNDQFGRLTFTSELVRAVDHVIDNDIEPGMYNLSNSGKVRSWAEIAALTYEFAGHDPNRVHPVSTDEYSKDKNNFAPRPTHSDLDLSKIQSTGFVSEDYEPIMKAYVEGLEKIDE